MQAEREQLLLLRMLRLGEVAPVHGPAARHDVEDRAGQRSRRAWWKYVVDTRARRRQHLETLALDQHDRDAVERHERAHLADERLESVLEYERRAECARAAVRRLEHVDAAAERVAQFLSLDSTFLRELRLARQAQHEPADDQAGDDLASRLKGHVVRVKGVAGVLRAQALELD